MKSLKEQIEFIDTKLLVLYGFKGITDYAHSISMTDPELNKIDLTKLNESIPEFRKIFHAKNFSLHKTDYKIQTESQAVCLLKTCLEVTSIPFDVSLKKNKRTLRLISKNNVLDNYIISLKMSENGTFTNTTVLKDASKIVLEKEQSESNTILKHLISTQDKPILKKEESSAGTFVTPLLTSKIEPANSSQKQYEEPETITKQMLNESIKTRMGYNIAIGLNSQMYKIYRMEKNIVIDLKSYGLNNKSISSCKVKIKSKVIGGKPVISQEFIDTIITDINYELWMGGTLIYEDRFINGQDIIINNFIIVSKCLTHHSIELRFSNINKISNYLDMLEIEFDVTHVKFYVGIDNKLTYNNLIHQQIVHNGLYNDLRFTHGMSGLRYHPYLTEEEYLELKNGKQNIFKEPKYLDTEIEKSGAKVFTGLGILKEFTGLELFKYEEEQFKSVENGYVTKKYDFITWTNKYEIHIDALPYYKLILENNVYIHCWDFYITGIHETLTDISIEIPGMSWNTIYVGSPEECNKKNDCVGIVFIDMNGNSLEGMTNTDGLKCYKDAQTKINPYNKIINQSSHLLTYGGICSLRLKIHSNTPENPIKGTNINYSARFFSWNKNHLRKLQSQFYQKEFDGFVDLSKLLP